MRYARVVIEPESGSLQPVDDAMRSADGLRRTGIQQVTLLRDGTCVTLYGLRGDLRLADDILDRQDDVLAHEVSGEREGLAYIHFEPTGAVESLLAIVQEFAFVLQTPVETTDVGVRVTLVGVDDALRRAVEEVPDTLAVSLEATGDYHPDTGDLYAMLTPRQQEMLDVATEMGYFEVPREATHEDIANELGVNSDTVGEHLRRIERKVLNAISE